MRTRVTLAAGSAAAAAVGFRRLTAGAAVSAVKNRRLFTGRSSLARIEREPPLVVRTRLGMLVQRLE
jgi:hypothetical protein